MVAATAGNCRDIDRFDAAIAASAGNFCDLSVVYHSILNKFGSDLWYGYGKFVLIYYHSILNKFGLDIQYGCYEFVWIYYHSILTKFGLNLQYGYDEFLLICNSILDLFVLIYRSPVNTFVCLD